MIGVSSGIFCTSPAPPFGAITGCQAPSSFTNQSQNAGSAGKPFVVKSHGCHMEDDSIVVSGESRLSTTAVSIARPGNGKGTVHHATSSALFFMGAGNPARPDGAAYRPLMQSKIAGKQRKPDESTICSVTIRCYAATQKGRSWRMTEEPEDGKPAGTPYTFQLTWGSLKGIFLAPDKVPLPETIEFGEEETVVPMVDFRPQTRHYLDVRSIDELVPAAQLAKLGIESGSLVFVGSRNVIRFHHDGGRFLDVPALADTTDGAAADAVHPTVQMIVAAAASEDILPPDVNHGRTVRTTKGKGGKGKGKVTTKVIERCGYTVHKRVKGSKPEYEPHANFADALRVAKSRWLTPEQLAERKEANKAKRQSAKSPAKSPPAQPDADGFTAVAPAGGKRKRSRKSPPAAVKPVEPTNGFAALAQDGTSESSDDEQAQQSPAPRVTPAPQAPAPQAPAPQAPAPTVDPAMLATLLASLQDPAQIQAVLASLGGVPSPEPAKVASPEPAKAKAKSAPATPEPTAPAGFPSLKAAASSGRPSRGVSKPMPPRKAKGQTMSLQDFTAMAASTAGTAESDLSDSDLSDSDLSGTETETETETEDESPVPAASWAALAAKPKLIAPGTVPKSAEQASADRAKAKQVAASRAGRKAKVKRAKQTEADRAKAKHEKQVAKERRSAGKEDHRATPGPTTPLSVVETPSPTPGTKSSSPGQVARQERRAVKAAKDDAADEQTARQVANRRRKDRQKAKKAAKSDGKARPKQEKQRLG